MAQKEDDLISDWHISQPHLMAMDQEPVSTTALGKSILKGRPPGLTDV